MKITRRDFLKYCAISAGALGLTGADLMKLQKAVATEAPDGVQVVWLYGSDCGGCITSFANSVDFGTAATLLAPVQTVIAVDPDITSSAAVVADLVALGTGTSTPNGPLDLQFNETIMAAAGDLAVSAAESSMFNCNGFVLGVSGAIQTASNGDFCTIWVRGDYSEINAGAVVTLADQAALGALSCDLWADVDELAADVTLTLTSDFTLYGKLFIQAFSTLMTGTRLAAGSWIEGNADIASLSASFDPSLTPSASINANNEVVGNAVLTTDVPLTGRVLALASSDLAAGLNTGTILKAGTLGLETNSTQGLAGTWKPSSMVSGKQKLTKKLVIWKSLAAPLAGDILDWQVGTDSVLADGTVLAANTWVELAADRANLIAAGAGFIGARVGPLDATLTATVTLTGRIHLDAGSQLNTGAPQDRTMMTETLRYAKEALYVLGIGTCASFGGIPAASGSVTGAMGLPDFYKYALKQGMITKAEYLALLKKTICCPGCPPHPDWVVGTISLLVMGYVPMVDFDLDSYRRPLEYYQYYQCSQGFADSVGRTSADACPWVLNNPPTQIGLSGKMDWTHQSDHPQGNSPRLYYYKYNSTEQGCIGILGCKGRVTKADCAFRKWNADGGWPDVKGVNWCVGTRAGCHGCTHPGFPDKVKRFFNYA